MATRFTDHLLEGDHASRPAFGDVPQGTLYACSDHPLIYQSDGSTAWSTWATLGSSVTEILDLPTAETDDTLVLAPDGAGGVEFRAETGGSGTTLVGPTPRALPLDFDNSAAYNTAVALAANGGSMAVAIHVPAEIRLQSVQVRNTDGSGARQWGWDLYVQNGETNTLDRVAASNGDESFTASSVSVRTLAAASAPVVLDPGIYWLVLQSTHATNTFGVGTTAAAALYGGATQTKTTTNPNGATLDFTAATWTKTTATPAAILLGRVFGESTAF